MNKKKILNWVVGIWFVVNLPIIPFTGSLIGGILGEYFFNPEIPYFVVTFVVFAAVVVLSKAWLGKYITPLVILSLIPFLYAALMVKDVQYYLVSHRPVLFTGIAVVIIGVICVAVVKGMRGELNQKL